MLPRAVQDELHRLSGTYNIDGREDKGANGWLFFATNRVTGVKVAIKFYWWGDQPALHGEPRFLAQFNSPNIIPILAAELVGDGWACFICPRYASDVEGLILREGVSVHRALDIGINILSGVGALHGNSVVHRDLKPANILLRDDGVAAIGDFGSVATLDSETSDVPASRHSIIYRPPESFPTGRYSVSGDLYQVGVVLYELLGGSLPKDPLRWLTPKERFAHDGIAADCDRSLYQDQVLQRVITSGRLIKRQTMPFWVSSKIKAEIARQTAVSIDRRAQTAGSMMASLVALRRQPSIGWGRSLALLAPSTEDQREWLSAKTVIELRLTAVEAGAEIARLRVTIQPFLVSWSIRDFCNQSRRPVKCQGAAGIENCES